jgi:hypothetical protein
VYRRIEYNNSCEEGEISALMMIKGTRTRQKKTISSFKIKEKLPDKGWKCGKKKRTERKD